MMKAAFFLFYNIILLFPSFCMPGTNTVTVKVLNDTIVKLPGNGLAQHDFFYAGEGEKLSMYIVRKGKIVWSYTHPGKGEISDAILLRNGNVLFAHQFGITEINKHKKVTWNYDAPAGCEIHTAQPIGKDKVLFIQNGKPAKLFVINKKTGLTEKEFELPVKNPDEVHTQFRHARLTASGTVMVAHLNDKIAEYDVNGKLLWSFPFKHVWSAVPLKNGNILACNEQDKLVCELNKKGDTLWQFSAAELPEIKFAGIQLAARLPDGNTIINSWSGKGDGKNIQAIEVTPDKKLVWVLRSWTPPADLGPCTTIQVLDKNEDMEKNTFGDIK